MNGGWHRKRSSWRSTDAAAGLCVLCWISFLAPPAAATPREGAAAHDAAGLPAAQDAPEAASEEEEEQGKEKAAAEGEEEASAVEDAPERETKSGYGETARFGGATGVEADLLADDLKKRPVFKLLKRASEPFYRFKDRLNSRLGLAVGADYNFLHQAASFSFTDDHATSGSFRLFGTWNVFGVKEKHQGNLVFRIENRHRIGSGITPRDLGFDAGSALSTASFKDFDWGITSLYWVQHLFGERLAFVFGQMDPGDFMDAYPLLSAWIFFQNDAFFNNPAEALPQQGIGFVARLYFTQHYYAAGGVHDALADADGLSVDELFDGSDLFYWFEVGWSPDQTAAPGDSIHLTYWEQDTLAELGTERSRGLAASFAPTIFGRLRPFLRVGYSDGDAALMRWLYAAGLGIDVRGANDLLGVALSWGAPVDETADSQVTGEVFYRAQLTEHLQATPALQVTLDPSFNDQEDVLYVASVLRMRIAF